MESEQKTSGAKKVFISVAIAMLIINGVTLYFLFSEKQEKQVVTEQKVSLEQDYKSILDTLDVRKAQIEEMIGKNASLNALIKEKEAAIDQEKQDLDEAHRTNQLTAAALDKARSIIAQDEVTIASLKNEVTSYKQQTAQLTTEKEQLSTDLDCEKQTSEQLAEDNQGLSKKVAAGSVLQIAGIHVEALRKKHNGEEAPTEKAKVAESLRVTFETGVNRVVEPGPMSFYVRIINPRGETIAVNEQGSGVIPDVASSKPVQYTKKADINYNQSNKKVVIYWNRNINYPGTYRVEVYQAGHVVGKGAVTLT